MSPEEIAQFLRQNPSFFEQHPQLLETILVPSPHGGRAIPLTERQIVSLREKARALEAKLSELLRFGEDNDAIGEKVHRLSLALLGARDSAAAESALQFHLREDFAVPHVAVQIWNEASDAALRDLAGNMGAPSCGPAAGNSFLPLFGESQEHVRSVAVVPLGQTKNIGVLMLGSEDPQRFYSDMGTLYLRRIGEFAAGVLAARG